MSSDWGREMTRAIARDIRTLLVVDDNEQLLRAYASALAAKWCVATATCCADAHRLVRKCRFDAAIFDLRLRDGSGLDLLKDVKIASPETLVVVITGYSTVKSTVWAMRLGAHDVISKPVSQAELVHSLDGIGNEPNDTATPTADRALWEHVHRVVDDCDGNLSMAARRLDVTRGTLRRWLQMPAPLR
jgi:two-component system response regulator RegA